MESNYKNLDFELYVRLHDLREILFHYEVEDEFYESIIRHMELIRTKQYRVAVIGEFSRGKSSLLNALLGGKILPVDITPTTATINRITFDIDTRAELHFHDGTKTTIGIGELKDYVTKLTKEGEHVAETIAEAVIYSPTIICQNNIDLIDTPGLNEDEKMTRLTVSQLEKIDAAIVLISAHSPMDQVEMRLVRTLIESREVGCLVFAVTFIDHFDEDDRERILQLIRERIQTVTEKIAADYGEAHDVTKKARRLLSDNKLELYPVSATQALKAMERNDGKLLNKSNFPTFQKALYRILAAQQARNAFIKTLRLLIDADGRLDSWYRKKSDKLEGRLQAAQDSERKVTAYLSNSVYRAAEIVKRHLGESEAYLSAEKLRKDYKEICVKALSAVTSDDAAAIEAAAKTAEREISAYTQRLFSEQRDILQGKATACFQELADQREQEFCAPIACFDEPKAIALRRVLTKYFQDVRSFSLSFPEPFSFFCREENAPGEKNRLIKTPYGEADVRCYNIITGMERAGNVYADKAVSLFQVWKSGVAERLEKLWRDDNNGADEYRQWTKEWVKTCQDDLTVNQKLYEKHRLKLGQMKQYAGETINLIQEDEIS